MNAAKDYLAGWESMLESFPAMNVLSGKVTLEPDVITFHVTYDGIPYKVEISEE